MLKFAAGNAKLPAFVTTFSLPAGWCCPGAADCLSRAVTTDAGTHIEDGPATIFRCFAASQEAQYPSVREQRQHNWKLLQAAAKRGQSALVSLIQESLPRELATPAVVGGRDWRQVVRVHVSGDFFSQVYFDAWVQVCRERPSLLVYAYTKSLPFWVRRLALLPQNLVLTASHGGRYDDLIAEHGLRSARVVFTEEDAGDLEIDHDDSHAMQAGADFALLLHGAQPKGSDAAAAIAALRKQGNYGYGEKAARRRSLIVL